LRQANLRGEVDTLIVCRGGGSIEDMWSFNDEVVVRAIAASRLSVVCGVGHETDVTLSDLAADLRAPTPTAAAELAAPSRDELLRQLEATAQRIMRTQRQRLDRASQGLDWLSSRLAQGVGTLQPQRQRLDLLAQRIDSAWARRMQAAAQSLAHAGARWQRAGTAGAEQRARHLSALGDRLALLDPQRVLSRGYALIQTATSEVVTSPAQLKAGERLKISLAQGQADLVPQQVDPRDD
jgi:exodeoxyribonuclease VII large subunit